MPEPTPEQLGREAGEAIANAIADNLEAVLLRLTDAIATLQAEQAELRDEVVAVANKLEGVKNILRTHDLLTGSPRPWEHSP